MEKAGMSPDNYIVEETGKIELCVAKIGEIKYSSMQTAVNEAATQTAVEIIITNNIELSKSVVINQNENITIDLNGYTLKSIGNTITNNGNLIIKDTSSNKSGSIIAICDKSKYEEKYDLDGNGNIDEEDKKIVSENFGRRMNESTSEEIKRADVTEDGYINVRDLNAIMSRLSGELKAIYNNGGTVEGYNI